MNEDLMEVRSLVAEEAWQKYDFGDHEVEDKSGFEYTGDGEEMIRPVYFQPTEDDPQDTSVLGSFTVRFKPGSAEIDEAYASIDGNDVGFMPPKDEPAAGPRI